MNIVNPPKNDEELEVVDNAFIALVFSTIAFALAMLLLCCGGYGSGSASSNNGEIQAPGQHGVYENYNVS